MGCAPSMPISTGGNYLNTHAIQAHCAGSSALQRSTGIAILQPNDELGEFDRRLSITKHKADPEKDLTSGLSKMKVANMNILLVFSREDSQSDCLRRAADRGGYAWRIVNSADVAISCFEELPYDLVIIDTRHSKDIDAESLCRSLRSVSSKCQSLFLAVIKNMYDKEEPSFVPLLNAGFNRRLCENNCVSSCLNELVSIERGELRMLQQLYTNSAMYAALQNISEGVEILDRHCKTEFVNFAFERQSGYLASEVISKDMQPLLQSDNDNDDNTPLSQLKKGQCWEGMSNLKRKTGDVISTKCKVVPIDSGKVQRYLIVRTQLDATASSSVVPVEHVKPEVDKVCHGIHIRKKESISKIHTMMLDTPLTKVINIILDARANSTNMTVLLALDKVIDILQSTELFTPHIQQVKEEDPLTNDLVGGLCDQTFSSNSMRQTSWPYNNKNVSKSSSLVSANSILHTASADMQLLLQSDASWDFDILKLERLTNRHPLVHLGLKVFGRFGICDFLNIDEATLQQWLHLIQSNYHLKNSYHNATHAADVLQATAYFLEKLRPKEILDASDEAAALIAAVVHDVDHPGKTSPFLINSRDRLAVLYNDIAVLENHHAAVAFMLTARDNKANIFKNLAREDFEALRRSVIDMVLATEMARHFEHLTRFIHFRTAHPKTGEEDHSSVQSNGTCGSDGMPSSPENKKHILRMVIKCADVSNAARPLQICMEWAKRIAEEYFRQTDEERARKLPIVMPNFDRATCSIPHSQLRFIELFLLEMYEHWHAFLDIPEVARNLQGNYGYWHEQENGTTASTM